MLAIQTASVWINGLGAAVTETHFDSDHNLVIILHGSCTFHTAPRGAFAPGGPGCRENESTNTPYNSPFFTARRMSAGMMALQPSEMWHYVESSPHCIKLAIFFHGSSTGSHTAFRKGLISTVSKEYKSRTCFL